VRPKRATRKTENRAIRILILEKEPGSRMSLQRCLSGSSRYTVVTEHIANFVHALYRLCNERFNLILLDGDLNPEVAVIEVLQNLCQRKTIGAPIIIVTNERDEQTPAELTRIGTDTYVTKVNLNAKLLERTIETVLELHASTEKGQPK